jgi:hypothetical protein
MVPITAIFVGVVVPDLWYLKLLRIFRRFHGLVGYLRRLLYRDCIV